MCKSVKQFFDEHPMVAKRPAGDRRQISVYPSEKEYEALQRIFDYPGFREAFNSMSDVIRHAICYYADAVLDMIDDGYMPLRRELLARMEEMGWGHTRQELTKYLDLQAQALNRRLSVGDVDGALDQYNRELIGEILRHQGIWRTTMMDDLLHHDGINAFRSKIRDHSVLTAARLSEIEKEVNDW